MLCLQSVANSAPCKQSRVCSDLNLRADIPCPNDEFDEHGICSITFIFAEVGKMIFNFIDFILISEGIGAFIFN